LLLLAAAVGRGEKGARTWCGRWELEHFWRSRHCCRRNAPAAQDPVAGAIVGGTLGGVVGGVLGRGPGAVAGAAIGATTGAVIAAEAQPRPGGYYWWRSGCYYRYPNGVWSPLLAPNYCGY
jgi:hypothetical protein